MKSFIKLLSVIVVLTMNKVNAQQAELDLKYTPPKNSILGGGANGSNNNDANTSSQSEAKQYKNVIKLNLSSIPRSIVAFEWEHTITEAFSVNSTLGVCYGYDRIQRGLSGEFDLGNNSSSSISFRDILFQSKPATGMKLYYGAGARFYGDYYWLNSDVDKYFELGFRVYSYVVDVKTISSPDNQNYGSGFFIIGSNQDKIRNFNLTFKYGIQIVGGKGKVKNTHDLFIGTGLNIASFDSFDRKEVTYIDQYGSTATGEGYQLSGTRESKVMPLFLAGYVFGLGF